MDDDFFRRESGRLLSALTRVFGVHNLALAEDVVQETLARAFEVWSFHGVPAHHSALLMTSAKNRAIDVLRRERRAKNLAPEPAPEEPAIEELFLPAALRDDELRMMFTCCHPKLNEDTRVALILNVLCGFSVHEIASAFFATDAAIEKRLSRGKRELLESRRLFELTAEDFAPRLEGVQRALYLLFSEGYHGTQTVVRTDLCRQAMRLVRLLIDHQPAATPSTHALGALMYLNAARLPARLDREGQLRALFEQDRSLWDIALIAEGTRLLEASAAGDSLTVYHLEAGIAALHTTAARAEDTRWGDIVELYGVLMKLQPSPIVALNRAVAIAEHAGPAAGLAALRDVDGSKLGAYPFYAAARGELELRAGNAEAALTHFTAARALARNDGERGFLDQRIAACERAFS
jgi:RNA polymerase sigma factor (sigma-70 family)